VTSRPRVQATEACAAPRFPPVADEADAQPSAGSGSASDDPSVPPTSGPSASHRLGIGVRTDENPLTEAEQVSVLEAGAVVVTHGELPEPGRDALTSLAREYPRRVALTPYDRLAPGQVAFTAFGVVQVCDGVDPDALRAFVDAYAVQVPGIPGGA
jgi:hypothetical protein